MNKIVNHHFNQIEDTNAMVIYKSKLVNLIGTLCLQTLQAFVNRKSKIVNLIGTLCLQTLQAFVNRKSKIVNQHA
jgi:hypothetical protein